MVWVFNYCGEVWLPAKVILCIFFGVSVMGQGVWYEVNMFGDKIDYGGCVNMLIILCFLLLVKGNLQYINLVEIEKI